MSATTTRKPTKNCKPATNGEPRLHDDGVWHGPLKEMPEGIRRLLTYPLPYRRKERTTAFIEKLATAVEEMHGIERVDWCGPTNEPFEIAPNKFEQPDESRAITISFSVTVMDAVWFSIDEEDWTTEIADELLRQAEFLMAASDMVLWVTEHEADKRELISVG